jgi:UDP-2,4-diacetamido-2,4,6-trideoxy-beta-L-altropyranose hydrolase
MRPLRNDDRTILVRADGDAKIGTGHVMRCLALAQAWSKGGGDACFASAQITPSLEQRLLEDAAQTIDLARELGAAWVVADGYRFGSKYQKQIKAAGFRLLLLDDYGHAEHYYADYVLNQNLSVDRKIYANREPSTRLLLGGRHALLRREFAAWRGWNRQIPAIGRKILLTLGGSDRNNMTGDILDALTSLRIDDLEIVAVVGGSSPHAKKLQAIASNHPKSVRLVVDAFNISELMAWADIAIAAGGTTTWELAFMGLPALLFVLAKNQRLVAEQLHAARLARNLGSRYQSSPKQLLREVEMLLNSRATRAEMSRIGRTLVDGSGSERVCLRLREDMLRFRSAAMEDRELIWQWANDPATRAVSFSSDAIRWKDHIAWFDAMLANADCYLWLALNKKGKLIGQVRFDVCAGNATVSVGLGKVHRGKDWGALLIWSACRKLFREQSVDKIHAYIKLDNIASIRAFEKAGFEKSGNTTIKGCLALNFQLTRANAET